MSENDISKSLGGNPGPGNGNKSKPSIVPAVVFLVVVLVLGSLGVWFMVKGMKKNAAAQPPREAQVRKVEDDTASKLKAEDDAAFKQMQTEDTKGGKTKSDVDAKRSEDEKRMGDLKKEQEEKLKETKGKVDRYLK